MRYDSSGALKLTTEYYNGSAWSTISSVPNVPRYWSGATGLYNDIFLCGGYHNSIGSLKSCERFDGSVWSTVGSRYDI